MHMVQVVSVYQKVHVSLNDFKRFLNLFLLIYNHICGKTTTKLFLSVVLYTHDIYNNIFSCGYSYSVDYSAKYNNEIPKSLFLNYNFKDN